LLMRDPQDNSTRNACIALRLGLGFIWVYEGLVPKILQPMSGFEKDVVAASGLVPNGFEVPLIHVLGVLEVILGLLIVTGVWIRPLCGVQAAMVGLFTVIIPIMHPATLTHPFGLLTKNIPILGAIAALWFLQRNTTGDSSQKESHGRG
jgi:uncharacterized membrane protein YphA (DoxX/SURF4 family)